jgi:hypothetical protein
VAEAGSLAIVAIVAIVAVAVAGTEVERVR